MKLNRGQLVEMARDATLVIADLRREDSPELDQWLQVRDLLEAAAALLGKLPEIARVPLEWDRSIENDPSRYEEELAFDVAVERKIAGKTPLREVHVNPRRLASLARRNPNGFISNNELELHMPYGRVRFVGDLEVDEWTCRFYVEVAP